MGISSELQENKMAYCRACGFKCIFTNITAHAIDRRPEWDKIPFLQQIIRHGTRDAALLHELHTVATEVRSVCDIVMFVDADMVFLKPFQVPLLEQDDFLLATRDQNGMNTGMLVLKAGTKAQRLLRESYNRTEYLNVRMCEQNAIRQALVLDKDLYSRVRLTNGVVTTTRHQRRFPVFHAAGCFSSRASTFRVCHTKLRSELRRVNMSGSCDMLSAWELGDARRARVPDLLQRAYLKTPKAVELPGWQYSLRRGFVYTGTGNKQKAAKRSPRF